VPMNPSRAAQGGDVSGTTKTDVTNALGSPLEVASASYDPGYECLEETLEAGYISAADLKRGFCSYGECIGEGKKNWRESR
jgi:hypothetical protein